MTTNSTKPATGDEKFDAFANDTQSTNVGPGEGLTFENGSDEVSVYGDFKVSKKTKPSDIDALIALLTSIKANLNHK